MQKINNINILRNIAASLVLLLHYCAWQENYIHESTLSVINTVLNSICFIAVPVFILISGALLLRPIQESFCTFYKKRATRILFPLFFWTLIYLSIVFFHDHIPLKNLLQATLRGKPFYHLWYLYMLLGLYAFTPFFRILWNALSTSQRIFLITMILGMVWLNQAADTILMLPANKKSLFFNMFIFYIGLFFAGRFIAGIAPTANFRRPAFFMFLCGISIMGVSQFYPPLHNIISYKNFINNLCAMSFVYLFFCQNNFRFETSRFAELLSDASFCVYLLHPLLLMLLPKHSLSPFSYFSELLIFFIASWGIAILLGIPKKLRIVIG